MHEPMGAILIETTPEKAESVEAEDLDSQVSAGNPVEDQYP